MKNYLDQNKIEYIQIFRNDQQVAANNMTSRLGYNVSKTILLQRKDDNEKLYMFVTTDDAKFDYKAVAEFLKIPEDELTFVSVASTDEKEMNHYALSVDEFGIFQLANDKLKKIDAYVDIALFKGDKAACFYGM